MGCVPRLRRHLFIWLFVPAVVFFFNPNIAIIDVLPDTIGYFLLYAALFYLADLNPYLEEARRGFLRMAFIDLCRLPAFLILVVLPNEEQPTAQLLAAFVFAVIELIYALPAWRNFFEGIFALISGDGELARYDLPGRRRWVRVVGRNGRTHLRLSGRGPARSMPELLRGATIRLIIWRNLLAVLPEMTALSSYETSGYVTNFDRDIYEFRHLFVVLAFLVMFVIGAVWLVRALRFAVRLAQDRELAEALAARWGRDVQPRENLFRCRHIRLAFLLMILAVVLSVDFYVDDLNVLPDFLSAALLVWAILVLRRCVSAWQLPLTFASIWGLVSLGSSAVSGHFFEHFYIEHIRRSREAYFAYQAVRVAGVIEQLFFLAASILLVLLLKQVLNRYLDRGSREGRELSRDYTRSLILLGLFGAATALTGVLYDTYLPTVEFIWCIDFGAALVFALYAWNALANMRDSLCLAIGED